LANDILVANNPDRKRYEARIDGKIVGSADYQLTPQLIVFTHTEVDRAQEGKGIGSALARFALEDVRTRGGLEVLPICPFIKAWIAGHPEFIPLVFGPPASNVKD
jgi:predicted GNAT family acetyltransferase